MGLILSSAALTWLRTASAPATAASMMTAMGCSESPACPPILGLTGNPRCEVWMFRPDMQPESSSYDAALGLWGA